MSDDQIEKKDDVVHVKVDEDKRAGDADWGDESSSVQKSEPISKHQGW